MRLISLTSIPPRFDKLEPGLSSLLAQKAQVDEIRLVIPRHYRRFPDWEGTLPRVPKGIRIVRTDEDLGPATKILPTAFDLAGSPDARILLCDDDRYYRPNWAGQLFAASETRPDAAIAGHALFLASGGHRIDPARLHYPRMIGLRRKHSPRARLNLVLTRMSFGLLRRDNRFRPVLKSGYADIFYGFGGLVVRPPFFSSEDAEIPEIAFPVDDIWLSGCLARKNIPIWARRGLLVPAITDANSEDPLYAAVFEDKGRNALNRGCIRHMQQTYGIWPEV